MLRPRLSLLMKSTRAPRGTSTLFGVTPAGVITIVIVGAGGGGGVGVVPDEQVPAARATSRTAIARVLGMRQFTAEAQPLGFV